VPNGNRMWPFVSNLVKLPYMSLQHVLSRRGANAITDLFPNSAGATCARLAAMLCHPISTTSITVLKEVRHCNIIHITSTCHEINGQWRAGRNGIITNHRRNNGYLCCPGLGGADWSVAPVMARNRRACMTSPTADAIGQSCSTARSRVRPPQQRNRHIVILAWWSEF
jgi:hypothetical protein